MGRKINQRIDWMGLVDEFKAEGQPKLPAYSRNLKENRIGGSTESFDPGGDTTAYSMNPGDFNMDIDVDTPDGWSDIDFGVPSSDPTPMGQWGLELLTKGARTARKFSKRLDDIVKKTNLKGSTRKNSPLYALPPSTSVSGISFQEYQAQQKLLADDWLKNLQLQNRPLTALPASSNVLDYYPIHRTDKSIIPKNEWPYAEWGLPPYSEKHYNKVTFKNGDIRFLNDWEIKNLPKTKEELRLRKQSERKIMQIAPDTHTAFLKQDITNIEKNVQPPGDFQENVNVERGFVPNINIAPYQYPKDISLSSFNQDIQFPWNITDPYINQEWLRQNPDKDIPIYGGAAYGNNPTGLNIPPGASPQLLATNLFNQASAEGVFKPNIQSWREQKIKGNFARNPESGKLYPNEGTYSGSYDLQSYIKNELGDLSIPFLEGPGVSTGYVGVDRGLYKRFYRLMQDTGYPVFTGAQFNEMFPKLYHGSPYQFDTPQIEDVSLLGQYQKGNKNTEAGFYITDEFLWARDYATWVGNKGQGDTPLKLVPEASLYEMNFRPDAKIKIYDHNDLSEGGIGIIGISKKDRQSLINKGYDAITSIGALNKRETLVLNPDALINFKNIPRDTEQFKFLWEDLEGFGEKTNPLDYYLQRNEAETLIPYGTHGNYNKMKFQYNPKTQFDVDLPSLGNPPYDAQNYRFFQEGGELPKAQFGKSLMKLFSKKPSLKPMSTRKVLNKHDILFPRMSKLEWDQYINPVWRKDADVRTWPTVGNYEYRDMAEEFVWLNEATQVSDNVITPYNPIFDNSGNLVSYEMENLRDYMSLADYKRKFGTRDFKHETWWMDLNIDVSRLHNKGLIHGDLHSGNIMVKPSILDPKQIVDFKIIDPAGVPQITSDLDFENAPFLKGTSFMNSKLYNHLDKDEQVKFIKKHQSKKEKEKMKYLGPLKPNKDGAIEINIDASGLVGLPTQSLSILRKPESQRKKEEGGELPKAQFGRGLREFIKEAPKRIKNVFKNEKLSTLARTDPRRIQMEKGKRTILNYYSNPKNRDYEIRKISESTGETRDAVAFRLANQLEQIKDIDINLYSKFDDDKSGFFTRGKHTDLGIRVNEDLLQNPFSKKRNIIGLNVSEGLNPYGLQTTTEHELRHLVKDKEQGRDWSKLGSDYKPIYKGGQFKDQLKDIFYRTIGKPFRGNFKLKPENQYYEPFNEQGIAYHPMDNVKGVTPQDRPFELSSWWNRPAEQQNMLANLRQTLISEGFQKSGKDLTMPEFDNFINDWYSQLDRPRRIEDAQSQMYMPERDFGPSDWYLENIVEGTSIPLRKYNTEIDRILGYSKYMNLLKDAGALVRGSGVNRSFFLNDNPHDSRYNQIMHERQNMLDAINKGFSEGGELPKAQFGKGLVNLMKKYKNWKPNVPFYNYTPYSGVKGDKIWNPYFERWEPSQRLKAIGQTKEEYDRTVKDSKYINEQLESAYTGIDNKINPLHDKWRGVFGDVESFGLNTSLDNYRKQIELLKNMKATQMPMFDRYLEGINTGRKYDRSLINLYKSLPLRNRVAPGLFPLTGSTHYDRVSKTWSLASDKKHKEGVFGDSFDVDPRIKNYFDASHKYFDFRTNKDPGAYFDKDDLFLGEFDETISLNDPIGGVVEDYVSGRNPIYAHQQPQFQPFVNPQYYTDLEKYYIGRHGTGEGYGRNYPMNVSGSSDRLWLNAHNFKSGLEAMAYEMWLKSSRRNPLGLNIDKSTGLLDKLPSDNLSREKLSSNLQWTDRVWTPSFYNEGLPPGEMPDTPLRSTFINKRNLPWNLNEKGGELEKAQKGREVIETGIKLLNRLRKIKPTSKTTNETLYRSVLLNDAIRNSKMFKGMSDDDILEIMATTIPPNTNTYRKGQFFQTLNFANDIPSSLKHIGKYTDNPTGMWRIGDTPYDLTLPNLTNPKQDLGIRGLFGAPATGILGGDKFLLETTPYDDFPLLSAEDQNLLVKYAAEAEELGFHNKDITPIMKQFSFPAFRSEGINVMTGNFPQFIGVEGTPIGSLQNISLIDDALKEKYKLVIPKKKGSVSEGLTIEQWLEKHGNLFNQKKIKKDVLGNPIIPKKQEGGEGKYHYSSYDPNASNWGNTIANVVTPQSIGEFAMTPFLMGSKFAKAAYTGGKAIYDKWFPPEEQEGTEIKSAGNVDFTQDRYGNINTRDMEGYSQKDLYDFIKDKYTKTNTSGIQRDLLTKLQTPTFRERYKKNYFNITGENLSDEDLTSRINEQYDFTAAGAPFHITFPYVSHSPKGYRRRSNPYINPFQNTGRAEFGSYKGIYTENFKYGEDDLDINLPEFAQYSFVPQLFKVRDPMVMSDNQVISHDDWKDTATHEYGHSYNTESSPLFRPAGDAFNTYDKDIKDDQGNIIYEGKYHTVPGKKYKAWLTDLFGEEYFDREENPWGTWAMKPWEISSMRSENEAEMKRLGIWDHTKEKFSGKKHLNKMLKLGFGLPDGASAYQLQQLGFNNLRQINYNIERITKKQNRVIGDYDWYEKRDSDFIKNMIINPNLDGHEAKRRGIDAAMDMDAFNKLFNSSQIDLDEKHRYADYESLLEDANRKRGSKKKRATKVLDLLYSKVREQIGTNPELEELKNEFNKKREIVTPKVEKYFNEIVMENEEISDDLPVQMEAKYGGEPINDSFYSRDKYTSNASKYRRA
jgi:hypothetical protein